MKLSREYNLQSQSKVTVLAQSLKIRYPESQQWTFRTWSSSESPSAYPWEGSDARSRLKVRPHRRSITAQYQREQQQNLLKQIKSPNCVSPAFFLSQPDFCCEFFYSLWGDFSSHIIGLATLTILGRHEAISSLRSVLLSVQVSLDLISPFTYLEFVRFSTSSKHCR